MAGACGESQGEASLKWFLMRGGIATVAARTEASSSVSARPLLRRALAAWRIGAWLRSVDGCAAQLIRCGGAEVMMLGVGCSREGAISEWHAEQLLLLQRGLREFSLIPH